MIDSLAARRSRYDGVVIPTIWVTLALSLLIHAAILWQLVPKVKLSLPEKPEISNTGSLVVRLAPPPAPPLAPPAARFERPTSTTPLAPPSKATIQPRSVPPPIALNRPAPDAAPSPAIPAAIAPAPVRSATEGDLTSYIEEQRRARAESARSPLPDIVSQAPPVEDDNQRTKRIVAANLAPPRATFGYDPNKHGGAFVIRRMGYSDAEFMFYGWNAEVGRNTAQLIEVKKGANSDIYIAVVRTVIAIIRGQVQDQDFLWDSRRLGRALMLSAHVKDNAGLEDFLMHEFYYDQRSPQYSGRP